MRRRFLWVCAAGGLGLFGILHRRWWTVNDITTGVTPEYPELRPRQYAASLDATVDAVVKACAELPRWTVTRRRGGTVEAEVRTWIGGFTDDAMTGEGTFEQRTNAGAEEAFVRIILS